MCYYSHSFRSLINRNTHETYSVMPCQRSLVEITTEIMKIGSYVISVGQLCMQRHEEYRILDYIVFSTNYYSPYARILIQTKGSEME